MSQKRNFNVACIPGDGIGVEIIDQVTRVLDGLARIDGTISFTFTTFDWSSKTYQATGKYMPDDWKQQLGGHDAILFGAVGWPTVPDHISL